MTDEPQKILWGFREGSALKAYIKNVDSLANETMRSQRFTAFIKEIELKLGLDFIEGYCEGFETFIKTRSKDYILRGRVDNLFGNVIIEFEHKLPKMLEEATEQLRRYTAIRWNLEPPESRLPYLCIASDGVRWFSYSPVLRDLGKSPIEPQDIELNPLEESDWTALDVEEVLAWLDRHFLRREILPASTEFVVKDFGANSHAFKTTFSTLIERWKELEERSDFAVVFDEWNTYLSIVYGSRIDDEELFISHTYLSTLAKLIAWMRISKNKKIPNEKQAIEILEGTWFKRQSIENFIEEDFFTWLTREDSVDIGVEVVRRLFSLLQNYDFSNLSEDVLKSLYQELVDPETRHDMGEVYTPDWLAHRIVNEVLDNNERASVLDPACGSGTFLYLTIMEKRRRLPNSEHTLDHILDSVYGIDVHPLAVTIAKTNYLLGLGDLISKRTSGVITIPIYLADAIKLPELVPVKAKPQESLILNDQTMGMEDYSITLEDWELVVPDTLVKNPNLFDEGVELAREYAIQHKGQSTKDKDFIGFLKKRQFHSDDYRVANGLLAIMNTLKHFIENNRDTIWAFVLKNAYKPFSLKGKFDYIVGNPPWIVLRTFFPNYQKFIKRQMTHEYELLVGKAHLVTHLEIATLFLLRTADLYLKDNGSIAFVLPRSTFNSDQHDGLRRRTFKLVEKESQSLFWDSVWDCMGTQPLFRVPTCVIFASLEEASNVQPYPVKCEIVSGELDRKNASLKEAEEELQVRETRLALCIRGESSYWDEGEENIEEFVFSAYKRRFLEGATLVPRCMCFVEFDKQMIRINADRPPIRTSEHTLKTAKDPYKGVSLEGNAERRFLYTTLLSADIVPFGHFTPRMVVLPIEPTRNSYEMVSVEEAHKRGFYNLEKWFTEAESIWNEKRGAKAEQTTLLEWINYRNKLTGQNPKKKFKVIYNGSGTDVSATLVRNEPTVFTVGDTELATNGVIADYKCYYFETDNEREAKYLVAILNSPGINELVKPMQSRGLLGPRDVSRTVLDLPIPEFDPSNKDHKRLVRLSGDCMNKVSDWLKQGGPREIKSIGRIRGMVRTLLEKDLKKIDDIVTKILEQ